LEFDLVPDLRLDDDFFVHKGHRYQYSEITSIEFGAVITKHSVNFIPTGKSYDAKLTVSTITGHVFEIKPAKSWLGKLKAPAFRELQNVNSALSFMTFNFRVQIYETQLRDSNFFRMGGYEFHRNGDLSKSGKYITNLKDGSHNFHLDAFNVTISKKKKSIAERLKASWSGESTIYIGKDRDCFIYLLSEIYGLRWKTEALPEKRIDTKRVYYETVIRLGALLSSVDGNADPKELAELKRYFQLDQTSLPYAAQIFNEQLTAPKPLQKILSEFNAAFNDADELKQSLYVGLLSVALADGLFHAAEKRLMDQIATLLSLRNDDLARLYATLGLDFVKMSNSGRSSSGSANASHAGNGTHSLRNRHLRVLGLSENATETDIKTSYRKLVKKYHPDILRSQGLPESEMKHAQKILAEIMNSYEWLVK